MNPKFLALFRFDIFLCSGMPIAFLQNQWPFPNLKTSAKIDIYLLAYLCNSYSHNKYVCLLVCIPSVGQSLSPNRHIGAKNIIDLVSSYKSEMLPWPDSNRRPLSVCRTNPTSEPRWPSELHGIPCIIYLLNNHSSQATGSHASTKPSRTIGLALINRLLVLFNTPLSSGSFGFHYLPPSPRPYTTTYPRIFWPIS